MKIKLIRPGTEVETNEGLECRIIQASLTSEELCVQYQIVFWKDGERKTEWVFPNEIISHADDPIVDAELT